ncbi:MAG TPA: hypothetical protein VLX28_18330, partial [Thermoanaerobaculia bacterium]|nr:hypothetical protein [Thermoanaerobaculia bacterium]
MSFADDPDDSDILDDLKAGRIYSPSGLWAGMSLALLRDHKNLKEGLWLRMSGIWASTSPLPWTPSATFIF